jgi:hypothetical protein
MQMRLPTRASDGPLSNKDAIANLVWQKICYGVYFITSLLFRFHHNLI